jgi:hypothetical protein
MSYSGERKEISNSEPVWTRTMTPTVCRWSGEIINRGEIICKYHNQKAFNKKIQELISPKLAEKGLPSEVRYLISRYYSVKNSNNNDENIFCERSANFDVKISKSGRVIRKPIRLENENFISGSGVSGCDQYDRGYDNGDLTAYSNRYDLKNTSNLNDFIVSDEYVEKENCDSEDECEVTEDESCDNWSETDDDEMSESEFYDSD